MNVESNEGGSIESRKKLCWAQILRSEICIIGGGKEMAGLWGNAEELQEAGSFVEVNPPAGIRSDQGL